MVIDGKEVKVFSSSSGVPAPGEWLFLTTAAIPPAHIFPFFTWSLIMATPTSRSDLFTHVSQGERRPVKNCLLNWYSHTRRRLLRALAI
jgi:hypothetical protein